MPCSAFEVRGFEQHFGGQEPAEAFAPEWFQNLKMPRCQDAKIFYISLDFRYHVFVERLCSISWECPWHFSSGANPSLGSCIGSSMSTRTDKSPWKTDIDWPSSCLDVWSSFAIIPPSHCRQRSKTCLTHPKTEKCINMLYSQRLFFMFKWSISIWQWHQLTSS